ncbi:MAG: tRNA preQ1(34) S-adenosylmethionine ribosyltransferase-isomerase QueA [Parvularculales bacterium]
MHIDMPDGETFDDEALDIEAFDFDLPKEAVALRPAIPRDAARLLVAGSDGESPIDSTIRDLPDFLNAGDVLVVNNTRVLPVQLKTTRWRYGVSASVNLTLYERIDDAGWRAFAKPARRLSIGDNLEFSDRLTAQVLSCRKGGEVVLEFNIAGDALDDALGDCGAMPLPPYITARRASDERDFQDYQTLFAEEPGAVAAPTAGLHFTPSLVKRLETKNIKIHSLTLHVGPGTFRPVAVSNLNDHKMHGEWGSLSEETATAITRARARGGRVVAVGTTSFRLLESAALENGDLRPFEGWTSLFVKPGYRTRVVDSLLTNFHMPRSTLFVLVSAFAGCSRMKRLYEHAVKSGYRFYSYGDACLLSPKTV